MNEAQFWKLLEMAKAKSKGDLDEQQKLITASLLEFELDDVFDFEMLIHIKRRLAYRADVWDAIITLQQGCGDDSFTDFQEWLISQGEESYYAVLKNPDDLAYLIDPAAGDFYCDCLMLSGNVFDVYEIKTGSDDLPETPEAIINKWPLPPLPEFGTFTHYRDLKWKYPKLSAISIKWWGDWFD